MFLSPLTSYKKCKNYVPELQKDTVSYLPALYNFDVRKETRHCYTTQIKLNLYMFISVPIKYKLHKLRKKEEKNYITKMLIKYSIEKAPLYSPSIVLLLLIDSHRMPSPYVLHTFSSEYINDI